MLIRATCALLAFAFIATPALAQLPSDAVDLGLVKISEKQKSTDLCPVYLTPSDKSLPTWEHKGVTYRGSKADAKDKFMKDPDKFAAAARAKRWENNFVAAMSIIWCPVTDEVNPGGGKQWNVDFQSSGLKLVNTKSELGADGVVFESCCKFCDEDYSEDDFPVALDALKERATESYKLTGGKYVEGASSPVEGAIKTPGLSALVGKWEITFEANGAEMTNVITFEDKEGELAGNVDGQLGKAELLEAEASEDGFFFVVKRTINGEEVEAEYEGEQDGDEITGVIYVTVGGEDLELDFTGKKQHDHSKHDHSHDGGHDHHADK